MEGDRGQYEPLPLALRGTVEEVESILIRPNTPQRSPRRGPNSPLSRTVISTKQSSLRPTPPSSSHSLNTNSRLQFDFDSQRQFWRIFLRGLLRFSMTFVLASLLLFTILWFGKRQVISKKWKRWFNAINLGLSMALGMSVQRGFKGMALDLRWRILSLRRRKMLEIDKILRSDSLTVVAELLGNCIWQNPLKWKVRMILVCSGWLAINMAAQISIAVIGLNYGTSVDFQYALTKPGPVLVPDLRQIYPLGFDGHSGSSVAAEQYTANTFGNMALSFGSDAINNQPQEKSFWTPGIYYFYPEDELSWTFVFLDQHKTDRGDFSIYTDRSINTTWNCQSWIVVQGGNGTLNEITALGDANGRTFPVSLPTTSGPDQTTYFTDPNATCGPGCSIVEAFEASLLESWYYQCNITVGTVQNATLPEHEIGGSLRNMAAGGIALKGYGLDLTLLGAKQYQIYPSPSVYGKPQGGNEQDIGRLIGQFAIGVIATAAIYSNTSTWLTVQGDQPQLGSQLDVERWLYVWLILGLIIAAQGIGFVLTAFWANRVVVKDNSVFSTATLLRSIMLELDGSGNSAGSEAIFESLNSTTALYTAPIHPKDKGLFHLELSTHVEARRVRAFPEGTYD